MGATITFQCAHCGGIRAAECDDLDNGTTLRCAHCDRDTVVRLLKPDDLAIHDAAPCVMAGVAEIVAALKLVKPKGN